jgi:hypothetical protein
LDTRIDSFQTSIDYALPRLKEVLRIVEDETLRLRQALCKRNDGSRGGHSMRVAYAIQDVWGCEARLLERH